MRWTYRFEEYGGPDAMSASYDVWCGDRFMFSIDVADYLDSWRERHASNPAAEALARAICQRMDGL